MSAKEKCEQPCSGFELGSILFSTMYVTSTFLCKASVSQKRIVLHHVDKWFASIFNFHCQIYNQVIRKIVLDCYNKRTQQSNSLNGHLSEEFWQWFSCNFKICYIVVGVQHLTIIPINLYVEGKANKKTTKNCGATVFSGETELS